MELSHYEAVRRFQYLLAYREEGIPYIEEMSGVSYHTILYAQRKYPDLYKEVSENFNMAEFLADRNRVDLQRTVTKMLKLLKGNLNDGQLNAQTITTVAKAFKDLMQALDALSNSEYLQSQTKTESLVYGKLNESSKKNKIN